MRFACFSVEGTSLSWWKRLQDEGHEVLVYIAPEKGPVRVGDGIVPKTKNYAQWVEWGRGGVYFFDCTDHGMRAELLRRSGERVVGGGVFCDKLESDREWSSELVKSVGLRLPSYHSFDTIMQTRRYAAAHPDMCFVFKTNKLINSSMTYLAKDAGDMDKYLAFVQGKWGDNISNIIQEKLDGFALSTARWWNGHEWTGPYEGTIEHKKFMDGDIGPATGCSFNALWFYGDEQPEIAKRLKFDALAETWRKEKAPPGIYDINALLSEDDGLPYFLEFTPRLGFDSEPTSQKGIKDLGKLLSTLASGGDISDLFLDGDVYCSVRVTVPPYAWEAVAATDDENCMDFPVSGTDGLWSKSFIGYGLRNDPKRGLVVADPSGLVGLSSGKGKTLKSAFAGAYKFLDKKESDFQVPNLQYRTDALKCCEDDVKTILKLGYEVR